MQQARDFQDESEALHELIQDIAPEQLSQPTQFKGWTINDVIGHLHIWNRAALLSLTDEPAFLNFYQELNGFMEKGGKSLNDFERQWLQGAAGNELLQIWREYYQRTAAAFADCDPKKRVKWAGPEMSALSSITARLMETWAHGQEAYDSLGVERVNTDRIKNIVVLGINTFGWTYKVNELPMPEQMPCVCLTAPSGEEWNFGECNDKECVRGSAEDFCQVVTQVRNLADVNLKVKGEVATQWMSIAQCFAGGAETPPAPGTRFKRSAP